MKPTEISHEELSQLVTPHLTQTLGHYTTPIFWNKTHRGSGVLVQYKGVHGILTASHVVHENPPIDLSGNGKNVVQLQLMQEGHVFQIPEKYLVEVPIGPQYNGQNPERGPDLTFIKIPDQSHYDGTIGTYKSFFNLEQYSSSQEEEKDRYCVVTGYPDVLKKQDVWRGESATAFREMFLIGEFEKDSYYEDGEFDYMDVSVWPEPDTEKPKNFGGISGGSVWQFSLVSFEDLEGIFVRDLELAGITFYQKADKNNKTPLLFHSRKSIEYALKTIKSTLDS